MQERCPCTTLERRPVAEWYGPFPELRRPSLVCRDCGSEYCHGAILGTTLRRARDGVLITPRAGTRIWDRSQRRYTHIFRRSTGWQPILRIRKERRAA